MKERYMFRGKQLDNGEWAMGRLASASDNRALMYSLDLFWDADPATVGQCTGLRDKNGKLIYEGDIVACGGEAYEIKFEDACFWITQPDGYAMEMHTTTGRGGIEVVGNIYDGVTKKGESDG
jgi:uncharacterized phage protein (TIGR01671 family)